MDAVIAESAGEKSGKVQKVKSIGERKNTEPIEKLTSFFFIGEFLCRRLALMHQGRVCVDISPICVRV